jgi:hypothetical protein
MRSRLVATLVVTRREGGSSVRAVIVSLVAGLTLSTVATSASAQSDINEIEIALAPSAAAGVAEFIPPDSHAPLVVDVAALADPSVLQQGGSPRTVAFEYSDGYAVRRKIHVYASLATLPLFVTEGILGSKLYDGDASDSVRSAHSAVAGGVGVLFGVNTVTGVWNLWEARKDPNGKKRRLIHGLSMLGADVGFVATGMLAPERDEEGNKSLHRNVALTSIGIATGSYLYMLFTR